MTTLVSDTFTGSNGTALNSSNWVSGFTGSAAAAPTIQGNKGRWLTGTGTGYAFATKGVSLRVNTATRQDAEISGTYTPQGETYPEIYIRSSSTIFDRGGNGYCLTLPTNGGDTSLKIRKSVSGSASTISSAAFSVSNGTTYGFRFQVIGTALKGRIWNTSSAEPGTWDISVTDSSVTAAGYIGIAVEPGDAAGNYVDFDNIVVDDVSGNFTLTETGAFAEGLILADTLTLTDTGSFTDALVAAEPTDFTESGSFADALIVDTVIPRHSLRAWIWFSTGWVEITDFVIAEMEARGEYGRQTRFDDVATSTWSMYLRNEDGRFTPGNPNSPYYPNVVKGKGLYVELNYAGVRYPRFWGHITAITIPPITDVKDAKVLIQGADMLTQLQRKTLKSSFVEESRRRALIADGGCDVFSFPPSQVSTDSSIQVAATTFENNGILFPGSTKLGSMYAMAVANGAGNVKSSGTDQSDGVLVEGQLEFTVGDNGFGKQSHPILVCKPQVGFKQMEFFFKVPPGVTTPQSITQTYTIVSGDNWNNVPPRFGLTQQDLALLNPDKYPAAMVIGDVLNVRSETVEADEWVLAALWSGSTEVMRIVLTAKDGKLIVGCRKPGAGFQIVYDSGTIADDKWRKITTDQYGTNGTFTKLNELTTGGPVTGLSADLTQIDTVQIAGRMPLTAASGSQTQCPPVSISGIAFQSEKTGVPSWYVIGAPPANVTAKERFFELCQYAKPINFQFDTAHHPSVVGGLDMSVVRTPTAGRTVLECMQELARSVLGYLWVERETSTVTLRKGPDDLTVIATINLEDDDDATDPVTWKDEIANQPTRVTASCPAGSITVIDQEAENVGLYKDMTIETCAPTVNSAGAVAAKFLSNPGGSLQLRNLAIDLVHSQQPLWDVLLPMLLPAERAIVIDGIPSQIFGYDSAKVQVESWTETYTIDSAKLSFETTPVSSSSSGPILNNFTVTATQGAQNGTTISAEKPSGTANGDLLVAIMTVDNTGSLAGMAAPDSTWTLRGSGADAASGHGKVWTKVATTAEPGSYAFTATGSSGGGSQVLMTDDFTGTNAAPFNVSKWVEGEMRTGAGATIDQNQGFLNPGSNTGYTGRVSVKPNVPDKADIDVRLAFRINSIDSYPSFFLRAYDSTPGDAGQLGRYGYEVRPNDGKTEVRVRKITDYASTQLGTTTFSITPNTNYWLRFQAIGSTIQFKIWPKTSVEPSVWNVSVTDTTYTAAGKVAIACAGGNAAGSVLYIDDVTVTDPNAIAGVPEAKLTLMRIDGAESSDPILAGPEWSAVTGETTDHAAPSLSPASSGLLINHWHMLTNGSSSGGSGGGGGGSASAFSFGMSGFDNASQITAANNWLTNKSLKAVGYWIDSNATVQQDAWGLASGETFGTWSGIIDIAFGGIFPSSGDSWANAASGSYDSRWSTALNKIKTGWGSRPPGNLHLRFAHEMNGNFSTWQVNNANAANFRNAWIRWANLARSIIPGVQLVWSPNYGTSSLTYVDDLWPGNSYVDVVGPDWYNSWPHITDLAGWTAHKLNLQDGNGNPVGIEKWRQYALSKGKPLCIPEWGNPGVDDGGGGGGGDHSYYAEAALAYFKANGGFGAGQVKYAIYFNIGVNGGYPPDYLVWASGTNGTVHQPLTAAVIRGA